MGPARAGIVAVSLAAVVGRIASEVAPSAVKHDPRETHHSGAQTEPRRRKFQSTAAAGKLRGGRRKLCPPGSGVTVASMEYPLMEGCLAEPGLFAFAGSSTEFVGPAGKIVSLPEDGGAHARRHWFAALYSEPGTFKLQCRSEELADLVHPSEATWRCIKVGDGTIVYAGTSEFSVKCGCTESIELAAPLQSQAREAMPVCESNGIHGVESPSGAVCCAAGCKNCGGVACWSAGADAGLTADDCCATEILAYGEACSKRGSAPCYIDDDGNQVAREAEDDEPCSVSALSVVAMEEINTYERGLYLEPECDGDTPALLSNCNFMGLGRRCRGCFMTLDGARRYRADFAGDMLNQGGAIINFCPGTDLEKLKEY
eukprot:g10790.t1